MTPADAAGDPAAAFDRIVAEYYPAWFRFHPDAAVAAGVPGYDHRLPPYGDDDVGALLTLDQELLGSIEELDLSALDPDRQLDCRLLYGAAVLEMEELLARDWRRRDPARYLPVDGIHQLVARGVPDLGPALAARLDAVPAHLRGARPLLAEAPEGLPPPWLASAVEEARGGAEFLRGLEQHPRVAPLVRAQRLAPRLAAAAEAVDAFADFLEGELAPRAAGDFACGSRRFEHLLRYRHALGVTPEALHAFGQRLFDQTRRELLDACRALAGHEDVAALSARIEADHPAAADLLGAYREAMAAARAFLETHELVTLPEDERLAVVETPVFLRHRIPFAAYLEPAPNDPRQQGYYYVTPVTDAAELRAHHRAGIAHTSVHEAWPGHHLQFVTANRAGTGLVRFLNPSATLYEGWALYSEQLMHEAGFLDRPEQGFVLLRDRLWRALRVVIDVEIHCRGLSLEAAAERMVRHLGFTPAQARGELNWYCQAPTVPMGYATGWALINACRDRQRLAEGRAFSLRGFHDRLLGVGACALPLVIERAFGLARWEEARHLVFGAAPGAARG